MSDSSDLKNKFDALDSYNWNLSLHDFKGNDQWQDNWVLDGKKCELTNSSDGLKFISGPEAGDNAHHGVLWTKETYSGDMKVTFEFTRLDTINRYVNILYFHANGIGEGEYKKNIHEWADLREVPLMATYFEKMDLLHISFAAFGNSNDDADDYIRVRRYPVREDRSFDQIEVDGTIHNTNLFLPNVKSLVCFIKTKTALAMKISIDGVDFYHHWDISTVEETESGAFGIRQMWQKESIYKNIKIYTL
ncbi:MAG: hypothetical protein COA79_01710 [Planctomycetota bacterium]|nr:MAG: hypothetical protein COA79_01710 [Planctomycetota bacterium]